MSQPHLKPYEQYKDSGIAWLGKVPQHWTLKKVRYLLQNSYEGMKIGPFGSQLTSDMLDDKGTYKVYGQENVITSNFQRGNKFISASKFDELSMYEIKPGDILITMMGTSGRCEIVPENIMPGIMDSHLLRIRVSDSIRSQFLRLLIDASEYVAYQVRILGKGTIMHGLNSGIVKELTIVLPTLNEQDHLLDFIDRETGKIDALVAEQRRLIDLLKEKRQAVISHAVTKGLSPNAPLKDSGIEWLGQIPTHWHLKRLKQLVRESIAGPYGSSLTKSMYTESGYRVYGQQQVIPDNFSIGDYYISEEKFLEMKRYEVKPDDILISVMGTIGQAAVVPENASPGIINPRLVLYRIKHDEISPRFLQTFINNRSSQSYFSVAAQGTTMDGLNMASIGELYIAIPPLVEQAAIINFLTQEIAKFDELTTQAERAIELLQERRTALISAAVTGKIDVRQPVKELIPA